MSRLIRFLMPYKQKAQNSVLFSNPTCAAIVRNDAPLATKEGICTVPIKRMQRARQRKACPALIAPATDDRRTDAETGTGLACSLQKFSVRCHTRMPERSLGFQFLAAMCITRVIFNAPLYLVVSHSEHYSPENAKNTDIQQEWATVQTRCRPLRVNRGNQFDCQLEGFRH